MESVAIALAGKLGNLFAPQVLRTWSANEGVEKLSSTLSAVQAAIKDAEVIHFGNESTTDWLKKIKDVTYDAEDIVEAWSLEAQDAEDRIGCINQVSHFFLTCFNFNRIIFRCNIAKRLKKVADRFDEIANENSQFRFPRSDHAEVTNKRETSSDLSEPKIYGRDEDIENVIAMLLDKDHSRTENIFILPIVGIGGLGKTTLAQLVYNNERIDSSFKPRIWVCVSEPFDVKKVLKQILESLGAERNFEYLDPIKRKVVESLKDKKYLLVLDDVWNNDKDKWNELRSSLTSGASGSSIMVTTRTSRVASITSSTPPCNLEGLSNEQCWYLLKYHALGEKGEEEHPELVPIGMEIAEKCKGVPLAAKSLGSLLAFNTNKDDWERIRDSPLCNLEKREENKILPVLRLSYNHLTSRLKQCFSYCSIYPKDSELNRIKLIYLWMANGFIQTHGRREIEEVGDDMFRELLRLSFFQDTREDGYGSIETCKMHDLMHDLTCSVMVDECSISEVGQVKDVVKTIRHLTVVPDSEQSSTVADYVMSSESSLRTLFFFVPINNFHTFKFSTTLRVLNLSEMGLTTLPKSISQLQHLRYLDLAWNSLESLPEFICRLRNLQMLDLRSNEGITSLPVSLGNIESLRYLDLSWCKNIRSLPESTGSLKKLQRLNLSWTEITSLPVSIGNMESLRYLDLSGCKNIRSLPESTGSLKNLQRLDLSKSGITSLPVSIDNMESLRYLDLSLCKNIRSLPESTGSLKNLQRLNLSMNEITSLPVSIGNMESLRFLDLSYCGDIRLPESIGSLKNLQRLDLSWTEITSLPVSISNMESLRYLNLSWCENIRSLPESVGGLRNLESLILSCCFGLEVLVKSMRNMSSLRHLDLQGSSRLREMPVGLGESTCLETLTLFVVGADSECGGINELHGLNQLRGKLEIKGLENVGNAEDAKVAKLSGKRFLKELSLSWGSWGRGDESNGNSKEVLEGLLVQPPPNLQTLKIEDYRGACFPQGIQHLTSLHRLEIGSCWELELETEDFQHLISLRELELWGLPMLRALPLLQHLTTLQTLQIRNCSELELETEDFQHLISLRELHLGWLPKLRALPLLQHLTTLQSLHIYYCKNLTRLPDGIQHLTTLQSLDIRHCHEDLHTRYEKNEGEEWHLISHIPHVNNEP